MGKGKQEREGAEKSVNKIRRRGQCGACSLAGVMKGAAERPGGSQTTQALGCARECG